MMQPIQRDRHRQAGPMLSQPAFTCKVPDKYMCDTLEIQVFLRFSGELVSFEELGQLDLIKVL